MPGGAFSREGRLDPVPIKVLPRGKSLDACAAAAKRKNLKVIKSKKDPNIKPHFDAVNKLIGDKPKRQFNFKFKSGRVGIIQAEQKIVELNAQLGQSVRLFNDNLGIKAHVTGQISDLKHQLEYFTKEKIKMEKKMAREKSEKDAITF